jgi:thioredoxin 1
MSNSKNTLHLKDQEFESTVAKSEDLSLIDFWAEWCGPCRALGPVIDSLADDYVGKVKVYKMNVDENPETAQKFQVRSIPTVLLLKNGQVVERIVGAQAKENFTRAIGNHLK